MISFDGANYTWTNGVELSLYSNNDNHTYVSYKYDDKGIRYYKNVNGTDINYYTLNNDILYETRGNNVLYYLYDSDGLIGFDYNNTRYYYIKNMHDDIIGIVNSNGTKIVSYTYDSWGNIISIKDTNNQEISQEDHTHIANINPFRYRSYYYDVETKLYYLNHRYYNPRINRFISPDIIVGSNKGIISSNLYAYADNNPVNNEDESGLKKKKKSTKWLSKTIKKVKKAITKATNNVIKAIAKKVNIKMSQTVTHTLDDMVSYIVKNSIAGISSVSGVRSDESTIGNKDAPFSIMIENSNLLETSIGISYYSESKDYEISISKSIGGESFVFKKDVSIATPRVFEIGTELFSVYAQHGYESYDDSIDSWETSSTKLTVNKIVIFATVYVTAKVVGLVTTGAGAIFAAA